jgi:hypothetical protein
MSIPGHRNACFVPYESESLEAFNVCRIIVVINERGPKDRLPLSEWLDWPLGGFVIKMVA